MKSFSERCYKILRSVPAGKVVTYKSLAAALRTKAYRAVGTAMAKNPYAPIVPCHRVVNSDGRVGGFAHGTEMKIEMLRNEGVSVSRGRVDLNKFSYKLK